MGSISQASCNNVCGSKTPFGIQFGKTGENLGTLEKSLHTSFFPKFPQVISSFKEELLEKWVIAQKG